MGAVPGLAQALSGLMTAGTGTALLQSLPAGGGGGQRTAGLRGGGSLQAFFQESYLQEHPEDEGNIEKLKDLIAWQVQPAASLQWLEGTAALLSQVPSIPVPGEPHKPRQTHPCSSTDPTAGRGDPDPRTEGDGGPAALP